MGKRPRALRSGNHTRLKIVRPAEEAHKPLTEDATTGLRAPCQWCKASIPIELVAIPPPQIPKEATSFKLEDLSFHARQLAKRNPTHHLRGWCSICKVYGFDHTADLGGTPPQGLGITTG